MTHMVVLMVLVEPVLLIIMTHMVELVNLSGCQVQHVLNCDVCGQLL